MIGKLKTLKVWIAAAGLLWATGAMAGGVANARIVLMSASGGQNNIFFIFLDTATSGAPACAATQTYRWVLDASTAGGKAGIATAMTAYAMGKPISITGTGQCTLWGDTETPAWIYIS